MNESHTVIYNNIKDISKKAGLPFWLNSEFCKSRGNSKLSCKECESFAMCMFATHSLKYANKIIDLKYKIIDKENEIIRLQKQTLKEW